MLRRAWNSLCRYVKETDTFLILLALVICACGLVLIFSGCQSVEKVTPRRVMLVQCIGIVLGFAGMIVLSFCDFDRFPWLWPIAAVLNIGFQLSLQFLGKGVGGNKSWIPLPGGLNIQPGEVGKVLFIYTMASHMALLKDRKNRFFTIAQLTMHMLITAGAVFIISRDLGVTLMYPLIFLTMLLIYGVSLWWIAAAFGCAVAATPVLWHFMDQSHRDRILVVFDPAISEKRAWHAKQTMAAISNGQLIGEGYLQGARTQGGWIPESHCDSIFAVGAEEFGFIGAVFLLLLLAALVLRIFYDCWRATDTFSALVCAGVGGMFLWQIAINVTMNLGIFPVIGLTLPLVSYGGSSMMITFASLGLVCGAVRRIKPTWIRSDND